MELKDFQKESLAKLDAFLRAACAGTLAGAFEHVAKEGWLDRGPAQGDIVRNKGE